MKGKTNMSIKCQISKLNNKAIMPAIRYILKLADLYIKTSIICLSILLFANLFLYNIQIQHVDVSTGHRIVKSVIEPVECYNFKELITEFYYNR